MPVLTIIPGRKYYTKGIMQTYIVYVINMSLFRQLTSCNKIVRII